MCMLARVFCKARVGYVSISFKDQIRQSINYRYKGVEEEYAKRMKLPCMNLLNLKIDNSQVLRTNR